VSFNNADGKAVLLKIVAAIKENKDYLSEIDGLIADGDHGMNMNKGFSMFGERIEDEEITFAEGLDELGTLLLTEIGGSMGPIYGTLLMEMGDVIEDLEVIDTAEFASMLASGYDELCDIVEARVGDKTLMDTLTPAKEVMQKAAKDGKSLAEALTEMKEAAVAGRDSTKDLMARYGRSSRLGERSIGVLDAGAVSCCVILTAMADGIIEQIGG